MSVDSLNLIACAARSTKNRPMGYSKMEEKNITARLRLPAGTACLNTPRVSLVILLVLLLAFSSSLPVSGRATSMRLGNDAGSGSLKVAAQSPQEGTLPKPYNILRKGLDSNNYLAPLLELKAHETQYLASEEMRENYLEFMTLLHSYVGDFNEAYSYENQLLSSFRGLDKIREMYAKDLTTSPIDKYQPRSAIEAIASVADKRQVIMINEEHRTPVHRALTLRLLPVLYARGFRYFAAETLDETDTELSKRGYPTQKTGFYTADPVYADVVRTALKLGFKVVPYEHMKDCQPRSDNPMSCQDERERGQAQNLVDRILKNDPKAKIFVHVGRSHNARVNNEGKFAFMGWHFRELTRIDPFVIDQVRMSERRNPADEHPLYRYAIRKGLIKEPTVFQSTGGELWTDDKDIADVRVFTPKAEYINGRPVWLQMGGLRQAQTVDLKKLKLNTQSGLFKGQRPLLVQAFVEEESMEAIPVDQIALYPGKQIPVMMLTKGSFQIRMIDESGTTLGRYKLVVK
jgi:hypothetical protein